MARTIRVKHASAGAVASGAGAAGALAVGAVAIGALAIGTLAIGSLAIGRFVLGKFFVGRARFKFIHIDEHTVDRLRVNDLTVSGSLRTPSR